jgi:hypothetical protein
MWLPGVPDLARRFVIWRMLVMRNEERRRRKRLTRDESSPLGGLDMLKLVDKER